MKTKLLSLTLVAALLTTLVPTTVPAYAADTATKATKAYAVALGYPYNFTLSVQDDSLVLSGNAPSYMGDYADNPKLIVDLIKPVASTSTIGSDGIALVTENTTKAIKSVLDEIGPLASVPGYSSLVSTPPSYTHEDVANFVNALVQRNTRLDHDCTSTLIYKLLYKKDDAGGYIDRESSTIKIIGTPNLTVSSILHLMLRAAPSVVTTVKTIAYTLNPYSSDMAPTITVKDDKGHDILTSDWPNVPKMDLSGVADGVYNIRVRFSTGGSYAMYLYCDDILLVVKGGKASLQLLPTYVRGAGEWYMGYSLDKWNVRPAITEADAYKW